MKVWIGYASSHSTGVAVMGTFTTLEAATEAAHLLMLLARANAMGLPEDQAAALLAPRGLERPAFDLACGQRKVQMDMNGGGWPFSSLGLKPSPTPAGGFVVSFRCGGEMNGAVPTEVLSEPLRDLLEGLGAVAIEFSFDG